MMNKKDLIKKDRPTIMGILNITPDSFSDGSKFNTIKKAIKRARELEKEGADIIDIGGESTGPNSVNVTEKEELERVIPIIKELRKNTDLPISIDTYKAEIARQAMESGASMINDVTALRGDKEMGKIAVKYKCPVIMMFSKDKTARTTSKKMNYNDIIKTILEFFEERINYAKRQGVKPSQIVIDPGMGQFISAIPKYSYEIISRLDKLKKLKHPILLGISRKSFLGGEMKKRTEKGLLVSGIAYLNGASILRTHDVKETIKFFKQF